MSEFIQALLDPAAPFLRYAVIMGTLSSLAFGCVGSFVVARRISYIAGAIAHAVLGGIGAAVYLQRAQGLEFMTPLRGALLAALLAAVLISVARGSGREREDSLIGVIWALGMAIGLVFLYATPGYVDPMGYLFGNILIVSRTDLIAVAVLDLIILALCALFYGRLKAVCFDEEFARLRGIPVNLYYLLLLCLVALSVVLLVSIAGVVLVVALLTLPAAIAGRGARSLGRMMAIASLLCLVFVNGGIFLSFHNDWPTGPTIILAAGAGYLLTLMISALRLKPR